MGGMGWGNPWIGGLTKVLDGVGPEVLGDGEGELLAVGEDLERRGVVLLLVIFLVLLLVLGAVGLALGPEAALLAVLLDRGAALLGGDAGAPVAEPGEEAETAEADLGDLILQGLLVGREVLDQLGLEGAVGARDGGAVLLPDLVDEGEDAVGQVLALLPANGHGLADEAGPAVLGVAVPELLLEDGVLEVVVGVELEADGDAAGVALGAVGDLEVGDGDVLQGGQEEGGVGGLDVLVDVGGGLLEDQGPEVGNLRDRLRALLVQRLSEGEMLARWLGREGGVC